MTPLNKLNIRHLRLYRDKGEVIHPHFIRNNEESTQVLCRCVPMHMYKCMKVTFAYTYQIKLIICIYMCVCVPVLRSHHAAITIIALIFLCYCCCSSNSGNSNTVVAVEIPN